jgi:hypothetical protein
MKTEYIDRLRGEKAALEGILFEEGWRDGRAYAKGASYRELKLVEKMVEASGYDFGMAEINADMLACQACEVDSPDCDTRNWVETNLSTSWQDEEEYIRGFIEGALDILAEADSAESKKD